MNQLNRFGIAAALAGAMTAVCLHAQDAATPRTADGHPDLSGMWGGGGGGGAAKPDEKGNLTVLQRGRPCSKQQFDAGNCAPGINFERDSGVTQRMGPEIPIYKPEFWERVQYLDRNGTKEDPEFHCKPSGVPRMGPPAQIVQTPEELVFLYVSPPAQGWGDQYRVIPTDGRAHTSLADLDGTWKGESIGRWEDDTLIVDTIGFTDASWLEIGGYLHSENMHVIERFRREGELLTWQVTVEDPDVLIKPWVMNPRTLKINADPKAMLPESLPCVERDLSHLVTKEHH